MTDFRPGKLRLTVGVSVDTVPAMLRLPELSLGQLELDVLDVLWADGPLKPGDVHGRLGDQRSISVNTVSSALKRLVEKGLLERQKVSHAYVYATIVNRAELQRELISELASQFGGGTGVLAAFVDLAEAEGEETLRALERMIVDRLQEDP